MESTEAAIKYVVHTFVVDVKIIGEHWFVHFDGSKESLAMCHKSESSPFVIGEKVKISFERMPDAKPSQPSV